MVVYWTQPAVEDLLQISDYTLKHFGAAQARRTALAISSAAESISDFPSLGRTGRKSGTRELVIAGLPFVIVYRVRPDVIEVVRVLHGSRKWP